MREVVERSETEGRGDLGGVEVEAEENPAV